MNSGGSMLGVVINAQCWINARSHNQCITIHDAGLTLGASARSYCLVMRSSHCLCYYFYCYLCCYPLCPTAAFNLTVVLEPVCL